MSNYPKIRCRPTYLNYSVQAIDKEKDEEKKLIQVQRIAKKCTDDYLAATSLHGVKFLNAKICWQRLFWLCMISISIFCCGYLIYKTYLKWDQTPVIVSFSERATPVWRIPFPAITVCSETKTNKSIVNFTEIYKRILNTQLANGTIMFDNRTSSSQTEYEHLQTLLQICSTNLVANIENSENATGTNPTIDYTRILDEIIPHFNRTYLFCRWKNVQTSCDELFKSVYTEQGICYTFNGLNANQLYRNGTVQYEEFMKKKQELSQLQWSLENGYENTNSDENSFPKRVLGAGIRAGIFMVLQEFQQNLEYICRGPVQGFKVILHSPDDFPQVSNQFLRIPYEKEILVSVSPKMIVTSPSLHHYSSERRQCFFSKERHLKYFKIYTQGNCEIECFTNFTLSKCGCVQFSMPRTYDIPVCNVTQIKCLYAAEHELLQQKFKEGLQASLAPESTGDKIDIKCNCLPACTSLVYQAEISQANFDLRNLLIAYNDTSYIDNNPGFKMSRLLIFFKENQFITSRRSELYDHLDFLASCGGLFGLFMGFSTLSLVDIIFYFIQFLLKLKTVKKSQTYVVNSDDNNNNNQNHFVSDRKYFAQKL